LEDSCTEEGGKKTKHTNKALLLNDLELKTKRFFFSHTIVEEESQMND
jgi:hypothetical protein